MESQQTVVLAEEVPIESDQVVLVETEHVALGPNEVPVEVEVPMELEQVPVVSEQVVMATEEMSVAGNGNIRSQAVAIAAGEGSESRDEFMTPDELIVEEPIEIGNGTLCSIDLIVMFILVMILM